MKHKRLVGGLVCGLFLFAISALPAFAHNAPDDGPAAWIMADWMLLSFLIFAGAAFFVFLVALKNGFFRNLEQAKYYILEIDEPDYFTPDWARKKDEEDGDGP